MKKEELFLQKITELKETAKLQGHVLSKDQVDEFLEENELNEEQANFLYDYLKQNKIGIDEKVNPDEYLTREDVNYLELYLEELKELPQVSDAQKLAYSMAAMAGETNAKRRLLEAYLPYVADIAKLYAGQGIDLEDLIGEGNVALASGVEMLGALEKPEEVQGMLGKVIMDAMEELINEDNLERKTDQKVEQRVNKVADKARELAQDLRRKVTVEELVEETGMSEKEIRDAMRISANRIEDIES